MEDTTGPSALAVAAPVAIPPRERRSPPQTPPPATTDDPAPVVKETPGSGAPAPARKPPLPARGGRGGNGGGGGGWDDDFRADMRRNQSDGSFAGTGGESGRQPTRSKSTQDIYTKQELEASAASKEKFFTRGWRRTRRCYLRYQNWLHLTVIPSTEEVQHNEKH